MQHNSYRRWITLAIISFSGGVSFDLAYLRYIYQIPMAKFMGFSNTEIGLIMSTFGIAAIILYAPSGVIADKFSHRKMITSAMIITGLLGLLMATYPPLWVMLCIQIAFAITTILMLWSVSIKAASLLGDHSEQGKIMGWMEGLRGVGVMSLAVFTMWVFSRFAPDDSTSLKTVIIIYSVVYILLGILCWFFVSDNNNLRSANNEEKQSFQLSDIGRFAYQHHLVLQHGDFWRLHHLRHSELLHQLSDRNVWHVAGGGELHGDCDQQNIPRAVRPTWRHNHHLQQSEIPYPRDPNPFRTRPADVNCPARHEL